MSSVSIKYFGIKSTCSCPMTRLQDTIIIVIRIVNKSFKIMRTLKYFGTMST
jgi:hypothetical protein